MLDFDKRENHELTDAVIYARVSSKAQIRRGQGLESQIAYCKTYASYKNYNIHHIFKDSGISGSKADRAGITEMLKYLQKNKKTPHVVIVDDISRLASPQIS